ncbi:HNH endonuclease signature motif containing protein [Phytohabitans suffuscus]|nr:HNH endonuclease signature motif containing protein [Phytohabitans suffuscus]
MQTLTAAQLHLIREIDGRGLPVARHCSSTAVWLRERQRTSVHAAKRMVDLARSLGERPALDSALAAGAVNAEQATVIATTIRDLPAGLGPDLVGEAEAVLIDQAEQFEPAILRKAGERILSHVAPEIADARDAAALRRQEARAWQTRAFQLTRLGDGRVRVTGWLDEAGAATVDAALDPLCAPRHDNDEPRTPGQRRADALVEVCGLATRTGELPDNGGQPPHVVVTVPFDVLRRRLGAGTLDTGGRLSHTEVRRLACDAQIIPAVLGGDGQILDVGRARRLVTGSLRRALELRDRGCAFPGCDRPPRWCDGHHIRSWADGGSTSLDNSVLLCGHHHRLIHAGQWTVRLGDDGLPEFTAPAHVDPRRRSRRNLYHQRT